MSGNDPGAAEAENERHDKALEEYQAAYARYQENLTKLLDWVAINDRLKDAAKQNFTNTVYALKLYNQTHNEQLTLPAREPQFLISTSPAHSKNKAN